MWTQATNTLPPIYVGQTGCLKRIRFFYALKEYPDLLKGNSLTLSPVALKIALQMAGAKGGKAGSPNPVGGLLDWIKCTSICGVLGNRINGYSSKLP